MLESLAIYFGSFALSVLSGWGYERVCKKHNSELPAYQKYLWFALIIALPVFISTIRLDVGTDYERYRIKYLLESNYSFGGLIRNTEPLYVLLNIVAKKVFHAYWGCLFLVSLMVNWLTIVTIDYFKKDISIPFSLMIYYLFIFSFSLNGYRQSIAVAIAFYSLRYLQKKKLIKYVLTIVIAMLFHNSAVICLLFYLFAGGKSTKLDNAKKLIYYFIIILSPFLIGIIFKIFSSLPLFDKYFAEYNFDYSNLRFGVLVYIVPLILPLLIYKKYMTNNRFESLFNISLLMIPAQFAGYVTIYANRLTYYPSVLYIILLSLIIKKNPYKADRYIVGIIIAAYFIGVYYYDMVVLLQSQVYPYKSILF